MPDLVVYTNDVPALIDEAEALGYTDWIHVDELGDKSLGGLRTPLVWKWPEAIAVIRVPDLVGVSQFTKMAALGEYVNDEFVPFVEGNKAVYDSIWNPQPRVVTSTLVGKQYTIKPPKRVGGFL